MPPDGEQNRTTSHAKEPKPFRGKWGAFLKELSKCGNISAACRAAKVGRTTAHEKRANDVHFALAWNDAVETGLDRVEEEADRRATRGTREILLSKGAPVRIDKAQGQYIDGWVESLDPETGKGLGWGFLYLLKFSDTLHAILLKAGRPDKFADRRKSDVALTTPSGVSVSLTMADAIAAARAARTARAAGQAAPEAAPEVVAALEETATRAAVIPAALEAAEADEEP